MRTANLIFGLLGVLSGLCFMGCVLLASNPWAILGYTVAGCVAGSVGSYQVGRAYCGSESDQW